jgi:hypothetical protein
MPMTKEHIQEALSKRFITAIANRSGYSTSHHEFDYGVDLEIVEVNIRLKITTGNRYAATNRSLRLQLKSTLEHRIEKRGGTVIYDLNAETWNDLVEQRHSYKPLILVLFILPSNEEEWLTLDVDALILRKCAYWFILSGTDSMTANENSRRITIPTNQIIGVETLPQLFEIFHT